MIGMNDEKTAIEYIEEWRRRRHEAELQTRDKMDSSTERFSLVNTVELRLSQRMIFECLSDNQIIR
ncbi:hypothetical protein T4B_9946 [Trichinella pseudospiralis]|uniref:Uncharacterized protein n=1 Tax=Trichinella pseudospiralis TaxID=6337 RepID=A0A0V1JLW8_TRIPS|nr:hypothetical protein T4B_9946 [Trichinella pseudospiralis]KRZ35987.1 hypothetical protein T4C_3710 [Trichinella pseudospiralis]